MAGWEQFHEAAPELAAAVRQRFDAHGHKTMTTLRKDGSPRISGTEVQFRDGEMWLGSMPGAQVSEPAPGWADGDPQRVRRSRRVDR